MIDFSAIDAAINSKLEVIRSVVEEQADAGFNRWIDIMVYQECQHKTKKTGKLLSSVDASAVINGSNIDCEVNTITYGPKVNLMYHNFATPAVRELTNDLMQDVADKMDKSIENINTNTNNINIGEEENVYVSEAEAYFGGRSIIEVLQEMAE